MNGITSKYPVDFETLAKGTVITQVELEEALGRAPGDDGWNWALLGLAEKIKEQTGILCRQQQNTLVLMNDEEADRYNFGLFKVGLRKINSSRHNLGLIDHGNLSAEDQRRADSRARIISGTQQAAGSAMRKQMRMERLMQGAAKGAQEED